jgi:50S ribosomal subunit-associated GTPase HflX
MLTENSFNHAKTALLIGAYCSGQDKEACQDYLKELERLCATYGLTVVDKIPCAIKKIDAGYVCWFWKAR